MVQTTTRHSEQLRLDDVPSGSLDQATEDVIALVDFDHVHAADRDRVDAAILQAARLEAGIVDPNRVRALLSDDNGDLTVTPAVLSARYRTLTAAGVLRRTGEWVLNNDRRGNAGKPLPLRQLVRPEAIA